MSNYSGQSAKRRGRIRETPCTHSYRQARCGWWCERVLLGSVTVEGRGSEEGKRRVIESTDGAHRHSSSHSSSQYAAPKDGFCRVQPIACAGFGCSTTACTRFMQRVARYVPVREYLRGLREAVGLVGKGGVCVALLGRVSHLSSTGRFGKRGQVA